MTCTGLWYGYRMQGIAGSDVIKNGGDTQLYVSTL